MSEPYAVSITTESRPLLLTNDRAARDAEICRRFRECESGVSIGNEFGLTRERVRQILKKNGLTKQDGGVYLRGVNTQQRAAEKRAATQAKIRERQIAFVTRVSELRASGKTWAETNDAIGWAPGNGPRVQNYATMLIKRHNLPHLLEAIHSYDGRCRNGRRKAVSE